MSSVSHQHIDVLILVNWIHDISPESLDALITPLLPIVRYLLLDAIDANNPIEYRYKHDFVFLSERTRRISVTQPLNEGRSFQLFEVLK